MADAVPPPRVHTPLPASQHDRPPVLWLPTPSVLFFRRHRRAILSAAALLSFGAAVTAFAVADEVPPTTRRLVQELSAPDTRAQLEALADRDDVFVSEERIRRGDTLGTLLARLGVADTDAEEFLRTAPGARMLQQLKPGRLLQARTGDDGELVSLRYVHSAAETGAAAAGLRGRSLMIERDGDRLVAHDESLTNERRVELRSGEIRSSLFAATDVAGLPDGIATQIAEIFSGDIDFYRDLRRGDRFRLVYESYWQGGEFVRAGRILAIEFVNGGKAHAALWYGGPASADPSGDASIAGHYYGFDGRSLRRAFLRTPLEFTRISSGFGGRLHPIANVWRQHTGVDYAAPSGTPVRTTADGVVDFAGGKNGYGNVVVVRHQGAYSTVYGHLSSFAAGLKRGQHVQQGNLVGYVGMTGWATGPHLHYEFRIADRATDPLTAALPEAPPISRTEQGAFRVVAGNFDRQIELLRATEGRIETATASGTRVRTTVAAAGPGA